MHKKSLEAAAHLEQVEKSSDISESDSEDGPSSRSSISAGMRPQYHDDKLLGQLSQQRPLMDHNMHGAFVLPSHTKLYEQ
ncbi:hypothetical protein OESDEN_16543 [Oesophagostomum dentatum]|uniref:Uncharacterized protein n=1 Tax=Oesophagostomum dentatum TaxID=61180 RepID=A0A0B1SKM9_OESDE|nr:hypothetical protein OESDEN_16543 [Oesophagostomum dentatum]